ncbi:MAG TPA: zinc-dependent metalloprotease, partial [Vicinamibacteria bacterium]
MRAPVLIVLLFLPPAIAAGAETPAQRTQGLKRQEGFVPYYWDAARGQLLLEVSRWGEELLYGAGLAGGAGVLEAGLDRGQLGDLGLVRFERVGPRALLHQLQTVHRHEGGSREGARAVAESFPSSVLAALPVVAEEGATVLVDATEFLLRDTQVAGILKRAGQGDWKQDLARSVPYLERSGAFPRNTEIEVLLTFSADDPHAVARVLPDGRTLSLRVHHTFLALPEPGYVPREVDPRVGYISALHKDYAAPVGRSLERQLAWRWRLVKKDPAAALSEPVNPIVYYLDRGMPEPERSAVRRGALWWNRAFEAAGFKDALVVRDLPEGATFLDARYSGIEWIHRTERAWSIGDAQADPRTGEILHSVARIDSHRRRTTARMWRNLQPPARGCQAADAPDLSWLAGLDPGLPEEEMYLARLAYLSAHEVGHTLGLPHNWAATTFGWGSVMDYLAPNIQPAAAGGFDLGDAYPTTVGDYDVLAIRWGYSATEDPQALEAMVRDGLAKGLVYPQEGDPRWAEYDWGPDPVAWLRTTQEVRRRILQRFGPDQLAPGTPFAELQTRFNLAYLYHRFGIQAAQQYVGGQFQTYAQAGDGQTPTAWVPAAKQEEALSLLLLALTPKELDVPDRIQAALLPSGTRERFASEAGPVTSPLSVARALAGLVVQPLLDPERAARLTLAAGPGALPFARVLERLVQATWQAPPETARWAALRRVAQRVVLDGMLDLAGRPEASPEVRAAVFAELARLRRSLALRHAVDRENEAHLRLAERDLAEFL